MRLHLIDLLLMLLMGLEMLLRLVRLGLRVDNLLLGGEILVGLLLNTQALMTGHGLELCLKHLLLNVKLLLEGAEHRHRGLLLLLLLLLVYRSPTYLVLHHRRGSEVLLGLGRLHEEGCNEGSRERLGRIGLLEGQ